MSIQNGTTLLAPNGTTCYLIPDGHSIRMIFPQKSNSVDSCTCPIFGGVDRPNARMFFRSCVCLENNCTGIMLEFSSDNTSICLTDVNSRLNRSVIYFEQEDISCHQQQCTVHNILSAHQIIIPGESYECIHGAVPVISALPYTLSSSYYWLVSLVAIVYTYSFL